MANITTVTNENGDKILSVDMEQDNELGLATANTYVDKNIIIQIKGSSNAEIATLEETLAFLNIEILDLTEEEF